MLMTRSRAEERLPSSVGERVHADVLWVGVEGDNPSPDGIKHQLVKEGVVGPDEALHVLLRDHQIHLQVLGHLPDHLGKTRGATMRRGIVRATAGWASSHLQNIRLLGQAEQLAGLPQADAMQRGQVITAREDAHVPKLLLSENVSQRAAPAQVVLVDFQAVAMFVHFEDHLQHSA